MVNELINTKGDDYSEMDSYEDNPFILHEGEEIYMKAKKLLCLILIFITTFTFAACSQIKDLLEGASLIKTASTQKGQAGAINDYNIIYSDFIDSKEWGEERFDVDDMEVVLSKIFDFDGGDYISTRFDKKTGKHVIVLFGYAGGFGGNAFWADYYSYNKGKLNQVIELSQISQIGDQYSKEELKDPLLYYIEEENPFEDNSSEPYITVYEVNSNQVTIETYIGAVNRFVIPKDKKYILR